MGASRAVVLQEHECDRGTVLLSHYSSWEGCWDGSSSFRNRTRPKKQSRLYHFFFGDPACFLYPEGAVQKSHFLQLHSYSPQRAKKALLMFPKRGLKKDRTAPVCTGNRPPYCVLNQFSSELDVRPSHRAPLQGHRDCLNPRDLC